MHRRRSRLPHDYPTPTVSTLLPPLGRSLREPEEAALAGIGANENSSRSH